MSDASSSANSSDSESDTNQPNQTKSQSDEDSPGPARDSDSENEQTNENPSAEKPSISSDSDSDRPTKTITARDDNDSSDDSDRNNADQSKEKDDLFGDMSSDDSDTEKTKPGSTSPSASPKRRAVSSPKSDDEQKQEETRIEVQIPKINTNLGDNIHFVRFPNFLSVEPRPFDIEHYEDEAEEEDELDEEGRTRLKLKVENTIRWRKVMDKTTGKETVQSNARIVKWSDGTQSLIVGNEKFDVNTMPLLGDFNHLFIRQGTGLQGQAVFRTKLTFRPFSTNSLTHRKMMGRLAHRINHSQQKVKVIPVTTSDPNIERQKIIREAEEAGRAEQRREAARQKVRERQMRKGISADYLEDNDHDDGYSLNAIKRQYGRTPQHRGDSSSEEETTNRRGSYHGGLSSEEDSDEEGRKRSRHASQDSISSETKKQRRNKVISDDEEEEDQSDGESDKSSAKSDSD